jgi:L-amino acid N-acyltransferase YncA
LQPWLDDLEALGLPFLVAELRGQVVAYAYATPWRDKAAYRHAVEGTVHLAPNATGRRIGHKHGAPTPF